MQVRPEFFKRHRLLVGYDIVSKRADHPEQVEKKQVQITNLNVVCLKQFSDRFFYFDGIGNIRLRSDRGTSFCQSYP